MQLTSKDLEQRLGQMREQVQLAKDQVNRSNDQLAEAENQYQRWLGGTELVANLLQAAKAEEEQAKAVARTAAQAQPVEAPDLKLYDFEGPQDE